MKTLEELKNTPHLVINGKLGPFPAEDEVYGGFVSWPDFMGSVVFGMNEGGRMEHVSISSKKKHQLPTWPVMVRLKNMFFRPEEMVVQIHPAESRYFHGLPDLPNVLHLWRPKDGNFELLNHPDLWE